MYGMCCKVDGIDNDLTKMGYISVLNVNPACINPRIVQFWESVFKAYFESIMNVLHLERWILIEKLFQNISRNIFEEIHCQTLKCKEGLLKSSFKYTPYTTYNYKLFLLSITEFSIDFLIVHFAIFYHNIQRILFPLVVVINNKSSNHQPPVTSW